MLLRSITALFLVVNLSMEGIIDPISENLLNLHTNWPRKDSNICNIYDESSYCQLLIIDQRQTLVAVSTKCECPEGYSCPHDTTDTAAFSECEYDSHRRWNRCRLRCTPDDA